MIKHLFKMVWNRKRINGLMMIEIAVSFIVLFVVCTAVMYLLNNYRKPLGFSVDRVWSIRANTRLPWRTHMAEKIDGMRQLTLALHGLPEIESIGGMAMSPYSNSRGTQIVQYNNRPVSADVNDATDGLKDVLRIDLTAGRWFSPEDDGNTVRPAIINAQLAAELYGSENPIGKELPFNQMRVVGVVRDFRKEGEFSSPTNYLISRIRAGDTTEMNIPWTILIRLKPGITASFEEKLVKTMEAVEKTWTFDVVQLEHERDARFRRELAPVAGGVIIAGFLLLMVVFGLTGVLWQNVTQRTKEIGLRRAMGGTASDISRQIHGEQFVITTIGLIAGSLVVLQIPLLNIVDFVPIAVYLTSLVIALVIMYAITHLCSLIPGWFAMDIEPAEALHYE